MKKLIALLLALILSASLVACGDSETSSGDGTNSLEQTASGGLNGFTTDDSTETPEDSDRKTLEFNKDTPIEETVIYNKDALKVTAMNLTHCNYEEKNPYYGGEVNLLPFGEVSLKYGYMLLSIKIENTSDKEMLYRFDQDISVNGLRFEVRELGRYDLLDSLFVNTYNDDHEFGYIGHDKERIVYFQLDCMMLMSYGIYEIADLQIFGHEYNKEHYHIGEIECSIKTSAFESYDYNTNHYQNKMADFIDVAGFEIVKFSTPGQTLSSNGHVIKVLSTAVVEMASQDKMQIWIELENLSSFRVQGTANYDNTVLGDPQFRNTIWPKSGEKFILKCEFDKPLDQVRWYTTYLNLNREVFGNPNEGACHFEICVFLSESAEEHNASGAEIYNTGNERILAKYTRLSESGGRFFFYFWAERDTTLELKSLTIKTNNGTTYAPAGSSRDYALIIFEKECAKTKYVVFEEEIDMDEVAQLNFSYVGQNLSINVPLKETVIGIGDNAEAGLFLEQHKCNNEKYECNHLKTAGSNYCRYHTCSVESCNSFTDYGYCQEHRCSSPGCINQKENGSDFCYSHK